MNSVVGLAKILARTAGLKAEWMAEEEEPEMMCDTPLRRQGSSTKAWKLWHLVSGLEIILQLLKQANHLQCRHDAVVLYFTANIPAWLLEAPSSIRSERQN